MIISKFYYKWLPLGLFGLGYGGEKEEKGRKNGPYTWKKESGNLEDREKKEKFKRKMRREQTKQSISDKEKPRTIEIILGLLSSWKC